MQGHVHALTQEVLRTDVAGMPLEWIDYRVAATLYHSGQVAYACGSPLYRIHGGYSAKTRDLIESATAAWEIWGVPRDWLPFCDDNSDFYCLDGDRVRFWSHDGVDSP